MSTPSQRAQPFTRLAVVALGVAGWLASWWFFGLCLDDNGWDLAAGWAEAFTTSDFSTGLHLDLVAISLMLIEVAVADRRTIGARWSAAVILSLGLSASVSLAIYLVARWRRS